VLPPLLYGGTFILVLVLHWIWRLRIVEDASYLIWPGVALTVLAVAIAMWGRSTMHAAGTNISPLKPANSIVTTGPFRFTRNPLYLSITLLYLGLTLISNTWWGMICLFPLVVVMHNGVVLREEYYLEQKFGETYRNYRATVRRYL
jgi:protein-S-isoprenylcysteine O-methyltransferase Ste14